LVQKTRLQNLKEADENPHPQMRERRPYQEHVFIDNKGRAR
jgi:hypothetical protein